jgi:hypothetical protein
LCHSAGGELEQIQFLLGHVSVQTTERYLRCKQRIRGAVNDRIGVLIAAVIAHGTNLGIVAMSHSSDGITLAPTVNSQSIASKEKVA